MRKNNTPATGGRCDPSPTLVAVGSFHENAAGGRRKSKAEGINSVRGRRKAREFFPTPFLLDFVGKRGFRETYFPKLRLCVRPSFRPDAHSSRIGRFRLTKNGATSCKNVLFFREIHNSHIFPSVSPQRGLTSITNPD